MLASDKGGFIVSSGVAGTPHPASNHSVINIAPILIILTDIEIIDSSLISLLVFYLL
ncbi:hypothetical protein JCM10914_5044 [Paenibacillus sp. JCM 10914]|nr:hypothetical protein JCM10914_5044 [Paenibacillus sp. JCM 10914]